MDEKDVNEVLERTEKEVWEAFMLVSDKSLGNHKTPKHGQLVVQKHETSQNGAALCVFENRLHFFTLGYKPSN